MKSYKAVIISAYYDPDVQTIGWDVETLDDKKKATLVWKKAEFETQFKLGSGLPVPQIEEFNGKMVGKEFTLQCPDKHE